MRKALSFLLILISATAFFSCASTPPPAEQTVDLATAKSRATDALAKAKAVMADVAVKADYEKAQSSFKEAQGLETSAEAQAIAKYLECERTALASYNAAVAKRDEARKQLDKAKSDIKALETEAGEQKTGGR